ncbi:MAG: Hsp20/alpha crystallin family protein [Candidatus Glassbacteria bacterium]|nr:Hsp20/alpha crystallin family protein [Candidatus Glassbacteria bacterium]
MRLVRWNPTAAGNPVATRSCWNGDPFFGLMRDWVTPDNVGRGMDADVFEKEDHYILTAELPGVSKEDLRVKVEGDVLTIEAEKKSEFSDSDEGSYHAERRYGSFSRSFRLNSQVEGDKIDANFKDGVLRLTLPKREEVKGRAIEIK